MPADIDLRAAVLEGIDHEIGRLIGLSSITARDIARTALRHLREIVGMHLIVDDDDDEGPYCGFCNTYLLGRPGCSILLSLAPDYAPQAWAARQRAIECPCSCHNESNVGLCEDCSDRHAPQALAKMQVDCARPRGL